MNYKIDLNTDLGEGYGRYEVAEDDEIMKYVSSINVACGFHAGDPTIMNNTVKQAKKNNIKIGAHPGFNDLYSFGRRNIDITNEEVFNETLYQLGALKSYTDIYDTKITHVSPHGALGNLCIQNNQIAKSFVKAVSKFDEDIMIFTQKGELEAEALSAGIQVKRLIFADRAYNDDGTLASRKLKSSVLYDVEEISERIIKMITTKTVESIKGNTIDIDGDILVVHSDTLNSSFITKSIHENLIENKIEIEAVSK